MYNIMIIITQGENMTVFIEIDNFYLLYRQVIKQFSG